MDDHTRATWTYLVHSKTQVYDLLVSFLAYVTNHFQTSVKIIRSYNGTEIVNAACNSLFMSKGILHQRSMAYTPQQNGVVERKHRHLLDTARAIRLHANLPIKFWGDCVLAATYLINKMPMEILEWKSPYEKLFGQPPVYDHLRVIGCLCYAAVTVPQKDKFDNRGIKCVLLGYPMNQKGYRLYNLQTQEVFTSRDVVFKEDVFPFKDSKKPEGFLFVHDFPSFGDEFYPETTQTPLPPDPTIVIPNTPIPSEPDNENFGNENSDSSTNSIPQNVNPLPPEPTRRSTRQSTRPAWLKDFVAPTGTKSGPHYPLFASTDFPGIPQQHIAFLANVFAQPEPTRYQQAIQHPGWVEAMNKELEALEKNNTWTLTELPLGHKGITSKWVYKTKFKPTGIIERLKARLVVRGFNQKEGLDYKHTFSPVAKLATVRVLIAIATTKQWPLHQLDINNAFLHGYIDEEIYMLPPEGYEQSKQDYSLFVKVKGNSFTAALVYVDDVLITGNTPTEIDSLKKSLDDKFTIKDLGLAKYFLGIKICHTSNSIHLNQRKHILYLLTDAGLTATKPNPSPLPTNLKLSLDKGVPISNPAAYRRLVGRLLYLTMTRPYISYVVQHLSQFVSSPKDVHLQAAIHLLKYLKGTASRGLFYPIQHHLQVTGFTDADWASCLMTRKSLTGYCIFLSHSWVSWKTKKQATVNLHIPVKLPITLFCDNKSAQQIAANPCFHERTKHMDIDTHFTREKVQDGFLQTAFIPSHLQFADIMTKALNSVQHSFLTAKLGVTTAPT
ncbi:RmlC-like cupins superfamily protein [Tanacetum coccineum]